MAVYILQFSTPLGNKANPRAQAQYYSGWTPDGNVSKRIHAHETGHGAFITQAAVKQGVSMVCVAVFMGCGRDFERQLKNMKRTPQIMKMLRAGKLPKGVPAPAFVLQDVSTLVQ